MAIKKIGIVTDCHVGTRSNTGFEFFAETLLRMPTAMAAFNTAEVDLLVECGDYVNEVTDFDAATDDLIDLQAIFNDNTTYTNLADTPRLYTVGNHDIFPGISSKADFITALGNDANAELQQANDDKSYGYYDVGNLRVFILDTQFDVDGDVAGTIIGYISDTELAWLSAQLSIADAAGKWCVLFMHHGIVPKNISSVGIISSSLGNAQDLIDTVKGHNVSCLMHGHTHSQAHSFVDPDFVNSRGDRILNKHMHPLMASTTTGAANAGYTVAYIDDQTGKWFFSENTGDSLEKGAKKIKWTGNYGQTPSSVGNYDYYAADGTWKTNTSLSTDLCILFDNDYVVSDGTVRANIVDAALGYWDGGVTEIELKSNWVTPLGGQGASNAYGFSLERVGLLMVAGGFAGDDIAQDSYTWICSRSGFGKVVVNGIGGDGGKYIHISNNNEPLPRGDKYWFDVEVDPGDDTYSVIFQDNAGNGGSEAMAMDSLVLRSGIAELIDVQGHGTNESLVAAEVRGGVLKISRDAADIAVSVGQIDIYDGQIDTTGGSNAANGVDIKKVIHHSSSSGSASPLRGRTNFN